MPLAAIRARSAPIANAYIAISGALEGTPLCYTAIKLTVSADTDDHDLLGKLVTISERSCIVANTIRGAVDLSFDIQQTTRA